MAIPTPDMQLNYKLSTRSVAAALTLTLGLTEGMADEKKRRTYRRPRGTMVQPTNLGYEVEFTSKSTWETLAQNLEISPSELFDVMVEHLPLDAYGRPTWFPERPPKDGMLHVPAA